MSLPVDYILTGKCIPLTSYLDDATWELKNVLYGTAGQYLSVVSDTCDLTGAIDNMLMEGAEELKKSLAAVNDFVSQLLKSVEDILNSSVLDIVFNAVEEMLGGIFSSINDLVNSAMSVLNDIKNVIKEVVDAVKIALCDVATTVVNNVPSVFSQSLIAVTALKGLDIKNSSQSLITDTAAKAAGVENIFSTANDLKNSLNKESLIVNSIGEYLCNGTTNFKPIDNYNILKKYV